MPSDLPAWAYLLGLLITGVLTYGGVRYTARQGARAQAATVVVSAEDTANKGWQALAEQQREQLVQQGQQLHAYGDRLEQLERDRDADRRKLRDLDRRLEDTLHRYRAAMRYVVKLRTFIAENLPGEDPPEPPSHLIPELEG